MEELHGKKTSKKKWACEDGYYEEFDKMWALHGIHYNKTGKKGSMINWPTFERCAVRVVHAFSFLDDCTKFCI